MSYDMTTLRGTSIWVETCSQCKTVYAMEKTVEKVMRANGGTFYCPHGHPQCYRPGESDADRFRRERDQAKQALARIEDEKREAIRISNEETARANKAERAIKRHKKRAGAGVCPCCKRTVGAMARHIKTKHPDYVKTNKPNLKLVS